LPERFEEALTIGAHPGARKWVVLIVVGILSSFSCSSTQSAQSPQTSPKSFRALQVEELKGGSVVTNLGYGIQVNKGSSLQRRWFVINDPSCPVRLSGAGINTVYVSSNIGGDYEYKATGLASTSETVTAFQVRYLLFDIWGEHAQTLSGTEVSDLRGQVALRDTGSWAAWENDVSKIFTVVSFVARVRRPDGTVWEYDTSSLLQQVEKIQVTLTEKELTPEREKPKS
jgi:hypothetical protein